MVENNFIDYVKVFVRSGHGGAGSTHLLRNRLTTKGGPDGGNGGRGGHIILRGNAHMWTLLHLKFQRHIFAEEGNTGARNLMTGADGKDQYIEVPLGTVAKNMETEEVIGEITKDGEELILLKGGRGGMGNAFFKSSTHQTPRFSQPGEEGKEGWFVLELKVLADVGLVGFPNAGKSTLLSVVSAAKPKIADYAFTTLTPNLGIVSYRDDRSFIMADIPGIIEGAAEGKGLGTRFLRHIERNAILLFLIPCDTNSIKKEYATLLNELKRYNPELLDKKRILAISKADLTDQELREEMETDIPEGISYVFISSVQQKGIAELKDIIWKTLNV